MTIDHPGAKGARAVQYVRMSSDHQRYSIENQKAAIAEYAKDRGYKIIRTYADPGKSGLSIRGRDALRSLLADALSLDRDFGVILVLDVSRWGRFEDPDQAAHYEFICRQVGLQIAYCAEPFENDISPMATIMKNLKRIMAYEFSRELSAKCSRAHLHHARRGFRQGGTLIYGFGRQLIDGDGIPRFALQHGQQKALHTDRVRFTLGPTSEQEVVKAIFHLYVWEEYSVVGIARYLTNQKIPDNYGHPWSARRVRSVLTSELCIGYYTYNRTTQKLHTPPRRNPEHLWVRAPAKIEPLVSEELFIAAQARIASRKPGALQNEEMLAALRSLMVSKGRLSGRIIENSPLVPSRSSYKHHFRSLTEAYEQIGYAEPLFIGSGDRAWSEDSLLAALKRLFDQHGYISHALIDADPGLPSAETMMRKVGNVGKLYELIGLPRKTSKQVRTEALARRAEKMRGLPPTLRPRERLWKREILVAQMKTLLAQHGYISRRLIEADPSLPSISTFYNIFGTLIEAYRAAGWMVSRRELGILGWEHKRRPIRTIPSIAETESPEQRTSLEGSDV